MTWIKLKTAICITLINVSTLAMNYQIDHPCLEKKSLKGELILNEPTNALILTQSIAKANNSELEVLEGGIKGIFGEPKDKSLEIISDKSFTAYGWCYLVNGEFPTVMPKDYTLTNSDQINWFLGSSTYKDGQWIDYCIPVTKSNTFICSN